MTERAYIHILETEIAELSAGIQNANAWHDREDDTWSRTYVVPSEEGREIRREIQKLCEDLHTSDICRHIPDSQYNHILHDMFPYLTTSSRYRIVVSRLKWYPLTSEQVRMVHNHMSMRTLIEHMVKKPQPGDMNLHALCKKIGHPKQINQLNCSHKKGSEIICVKCFMLLRGMNVKPLPVNAMTDFYVPDMTIEKLRRKTKIPKHLLDAWARKNA
jgi:hypothetical protein